ncbi:short-chain dehydrogenase [Thozetella sp. PMI_491]|nr:short-chain dehydrogenase [Thozetella sp. PMI_491]
MSTIQFGFETEGIELVRHFADQVKGRTFLITGPSHGGIGGETVTSLAQGHPAALILIGRSRERADPTIAAVREIDPSIDIKFFAADLASLASVRAAAQAIVDDASIPLIDVIINNAAIMACPFELTPEGFELQLAADHLGHFVLTNRLLPKVLAAPNPRIVNVSSMGNKAGGIRWTDPNFSEPGSFTEFGAYGQAKTANVLFTIALNQRYRRSKGLKAFTLHPGSVATGLQKYLTPGMREVAIKSVLGEDFDVSKLPGRKTLQQGCATQIRAALDSNLDIGGDGNEGVFLHDCQQSTDDMVVVKRALDADDARRLWTWSEDLVGEKFDILA